MKGRSRAFAVAEPARAATSRRSRSAFNDRCDAIVATAVLGARAAGGDRARR